MNTVLWIIQIILSIKLISTAFIHALRQDKPEVQAAIHKLGAPARPLLYLAALGSLLGGLGLLLPALSGVPGWLAPWAAAVTAGMLLASLVFHLLSREKPKVWVSLILFALAAFAAYGRFILAPL